jgi:hypothetical protein
MSLSQSVLSAAADNQVNDDRSYQDDYQDLTLSK